MPHKDLIARKEYLQRYYLMHKAIWDKPLTTEQRERRIQRKRQYYQENKQEILDKNREYRQGKGKEIYLLLRRKDYANYIVKYPEKHTAHQIVRNGLRQNLLIRMPCNKCGVYGKDKYGRHVVQAHHPDYSKPLDVIWLCKGCHKEIHKNGEIAKEGVAG